MEEQAVEIVSSLINQYIESLYPVEHDVQIEMEQLAKRRQFPIVGPQVGRLLAWLVRSANAKRVLELGSGFGYSAFWFCSALGADGEITLTDHSAGNLKEAKRLLEKANRLSQLQFITGDGVAYLSGATGKFDIIFNDIDKRDYPTVIEPAAARLRPGGLFITDNALWYGSVVRVGSTDPAIDGVVQFNQTIFAHPQFEAILLPIRDGVVVARRR